MYGKHFQSMYSGSMYGAGSHIFAVWGYCISHANPVDSSLEINAARLADTLGETKERVQEAIDFLCAPDSGSRSREEEGRRLMHDGAFQYRVVNHAAYRSIRNDEERREYNRQKKREQRAREKNQGNIDESNDQSLTVNECQQSPSVSVSVSDTNGSGKYTVEFNSFWNAYPRKVGKQNAWRSWKRNKPSLQECLDALKWQMKCDQWTKDGGQFIPHPATWLNQGRWQDEDPKAQGTSAGKSPLELAVERRIKEIETEWRGGKMTDEECLELVQAEKAKLAGEKGGNV